MNIRELFIYSKIEGTYVTVLCGTVAPDDEDDIYKYVNMESQENILIFTLHIKIIH